MSMLAILVSQITRAMAQEPTKQAGHMCTRRAGSCSARGLTWCVLLNQGILAHDIGLQHQLRAIHLGQHCMVLRADLHITKCAGVDSSNNIESG